MQAIPTMENQMEKKMEDEMETGVMAGGYMGVVQYSFISNWGLEPCFRELLHAQFGSQ